MLTLCSPLLRVAGAWGSVNPCFPVSGDRAGAGCEVTCPQVCGEGPMWPRVLPHGRACCAPRTQWCVCVGHTGTQVGFPKDLLSLQSK